MDGWIQTHGGRAVDPLNPVASSLAIDDVAHALSHVNRFTGHTRKPYSVARHSLAVSYLVKLRGGTSQAQLWALLHDATEAYLNDIAAPVKQSPIFDEYRRAESRLQRLVRERFGVSLHEHEFADVHRADGDMLLAERMMVLPPGAWRAPTPPGDALDAFKWAAPLESPKVARLVFLSLFDALGGKR